MLYLYDKQTTRFDVNGDPIRHAYDCHVVRDEGFYLKFKVLLDKKKDYQKLAREMIVSAETPDGRNQFRIWDLKKKEDHVEVIALQLVYDLDNLLVVPFKQQRVTGAMILDTYKSKFKSSYKPFTLSSSVTTVHDFSLDDKTKAYNAWEVLQRIAKRWDAELLINGYDIRMIPRLGYRTNALLHEKKNISEFEDELTMRSVATRIHATSTFTPEREEGSTESPEQVELNVTVDSPLIGAYAKVYEKQYENNDCRTEEELTQWVKRKYSYEKIDLPKRTIELKTNIIDGTEINYGDDLVVMYEAHNVHEVIRCVGYDYDPIAKTYYGITLGDYSASFSSALNSHVVDATKDYEGQFTELENRLQIIDMAANGVNRITWGPQPIPNPIKGDKWFYFTLDRPDQVEYREWDGEKWVTLMDDYLGKNIELEIQRIEEDAEELRIEMEEAYRRAEEMLENVPNMDDLIAEIPSAEDILSQIPDLEDIRDQFRRVDNNSEMIAQIMGDEGMLTYSKNWVDTDIDTSQPIIISMEDGQFCFQPSMGKLRVGEPVTISGYREFEYYDNSQVTVNFKESIRPSSKVTVSFSNKKVVAEFEEI